MKTKQNKLFSAITFGLVLLVPSSLFGTASISGTALLDVNGLSAGDFAVVLVDNSGSGFNSAGLSSLPANADLTDSATYSGFSVLFSNTASSFFGSISLSVNTGQFNVTTQPIVTNDAFGILTFAGSSTNAVGGSVFEIWTDASWVIPADSADETFTGNLAQFTAGASPTATGTVVPEPSSFALLAGVFGLAWVMVRRRA